MSTGTKLSSSMLEMMSLSDGVCGITSWDDRYDNPMDQITLVSSDKVGFRVDARHFQRQCGFIRDLMTFPSIAKLEHTPIPIDHDSKIVRYFIDFVMAHSTSATDISMAEFKALFQISDQYQAENVDNALIMAMSLRTQQRPTPADLDPWTVFQFAATRDSADLARASIRAFEGVVDPFDIYEAPASKFDGIPGKYIAGLLLAGYDMNIPVNPHAVRTKIIVNMRTWQEVASHFSVI